MNEHFTSPPPPPDDETHDPLLRALRQQLGEGFGQEPPPGLWAGIREQLPATQPGWRRRRYLLPLLALLLLSTGALWQAGRLHRAGLLAGRSTAARPSAGGWQSVGKWPPSAAAVAAGRPGVEQPGRPAANEQPGTSPAPGSLAGAAATVPPREGSRSAALAVAAEPGAAARQTGKPERAVGQLTVPGPRRLRQQSALPGLEASTRLPRKAELLAAAPRRRGGRVPQSAGLPAGSAAAGNSLARAAAASRPGRHLAAGPEAAGATPAVAVAGSRPGRASQQRAGNSGRASIGLSQLAEKQPVALKAAGRKQPRRAGLGGARLADSAALAPAGALALLGGHGTGVRVPRLGLPAPLAAADVPGPWLAAGRRWAVQVLAGPALSYRTAQTGQTPYSHVGRIDSVTAGLERPALGWGAQVQLRRVLAGRWALAAGLGYQEYATRLSLDVTTYVPNPTAMAVLSTTTAVRQRDTYRLLTVPVQLSYLLGPRGPWQVGVLGGAEPGLYLGGRTTENSGCNCQQQSFASAAGSPYNTLSLALSLGLDVRLHLGGPASRWQLLAQPTGRYVATPFVRSDAYYYAQRQPYSLGLLLGAAWEW